MDRKFFKLKDDLTRYTDYLLALEDFLCQLKKIPRWRMLIAFIFSGNNVMQKFKETLIQRKKVVSEE